MALTSRSSTGRPTIAHIAIATEIMCTSLLRAANTIIAIGTVTGTTSAGTEIVTMIAGTGIVTGAIITTGVNL